MKRALLLCLWLWSAAALASSYDEPPFEKSTVLGENLIWDWGDRNTVRRIACEGRFCLWLAVKEMSACRTIDCSSKYLVVSDLRGAFLGASHRVQFGSSNTTMRFIGPEHVEVVTLTGRHVDTVDYGLDPVQVSRSAMKVSPDGTRFIAVPNPGMMWTKKSDARVVKTPVRPTLPRPRAVSDELLSRARALCPTEARLKPVDYVPMEYVCRDGTCLLLLTGFKLPPDTELEEALWMSAGRPMGPFCVVVVKGKDLHVVVPEEWATSVELAPTYYEFWDSAGNYGSPAPMEVFSRERPGYMLFIDTAGAVVDEINPYPVRVARSAKAALSLAPTAQAYTQAHITWGIEGWKDAVDLAFAWRLARVGEVLTFHIEVQDDRVVPLGTGSSLHSDHLELTVWQSGPRSEARKLGVLLGAGGKVEARDWTGEANVVLPSLRGTWRKRPLGYELSFTVPLADLGALKPLSGTGFVMSVSDADARGTQETLMEHAGGLNFWSEYPPSIIEYRRDGWFLR